MRFELSRMDPDLFRQLVDMESELMIPLLEAVGLFINRDIVEKDILKVPDQMVIAVTSGGVLRAALRYRREKEALFIRSILVGHEGGMPLRSLLREALEALGEEHLPVVRSVVQQSNLFAILFHERLGFERVKENSRAIQFSVRREALRIRLHGLLR